MPNLSAHVPDDWPLAASLAERVNRDFAGKVSAYVRSVVERDLAGSSAVPTGADPRFLEKLYAAVLPSRVSRFQRLWDVRVKLAQEPATQSEIVELMLRAYLEELEAEPTAQIVDAFDALPESLRAKFRAAAAGNADALAADPHITRYAQPEEPARHVAEDAPAASRTLRTLPHKPPKPKSTGTTP